MGLILDSTVLIGAERQGQTARQSLRDISTKVGNVDVAISVVTVMELAQGRSRQCDDSARSSHGELMLCRQISTT